MVWFGLYQKKVTKPKIFFKEKNRNRVKSTGFGLVRFGFLGKKPVQTRLARFFQFGSVFPFWLGFFSGFFCFGSVWFFAYKTKTEPAGFFKILIGLIGFFFRFGFFGYFFFCFLGFLGFLVFLLTPRKNQVLPFK